MSIRKKILSGLLIALSSVAIITGIALAATWEFYFPIVATDNSTTDRAYYPIMLEMNGQTFINSGKINSNGLNTNMQIGTTDAKYLISTTNMSAVAPNLPANGRAIFDFYTGYSPSQTNFSIVIGDSGYITVEDAANIELSDKFTLLFDGYLNTDNASGKYLFYKAGAILVSANATNDGTLEAEIVGNTSGNLTADGITNADNVTIISIGDTPDFDTWASDCNIAVNMGAGIIPALLLEEQVLTIDTSSITFSNIDDLIDIYESATGLTARSLVLTINGRDPGPTDEREVLLRFNNDTGNNYNDQTLEGYNAVVSAARNTNVSSALVFQITGRFFNNLASSGGFAVIPDAFNSSRHKSFVSLSGVAEGGNFARAGRWADTSPVTDITLFSVNQFAATTVFQLAVVDEQYLIEEVSPAGGTVAFATIPGTGNDLVMIASARSNRIATGDSLQWEANADVAQANYTYQAIKGSAGAASATSSGVDDITGNIPGDTVPANVFGAHISFISQYAEATNNPSILSVSGWVGAAQSQMEIYSGRWKNNVAITDLGFDPNVGAGFITGSLFSLYRVPRTLIAKTELAGTANITLNNIPQNYEAIALYVNGRTDYAGISDNITISYNTDVVDANYDYARLNGAGAVITSNRDTASRIIMTVPAAGEGANEFGGGIITLNQYSTDDRHKHAYVLDGINENGVNLRSERWESTNPITSITIAPVNGTGFVASTIAELVGIMPKNSFYIEVDGEVKAITDATADNTTLTVPDTASNITMISENIMSYADNITITINGTQQLYFSPNTMIQGNVLPDRGSDATDNPGTINWGTNYKVILRAGEMVSSESTEATVSAPGGFDMPSTVMPVGWFNTANATSFTNLPFYPMIKDRADEAGLPVQMIYFWFAIGIAWALFIIVTVKTKSASMGALAMILVMVMASMQSVVPQWIVFATIITDVLIIFLYKQVTT